MRNPQYLLDSQQPSIIRQDMFEALDDLEELSDDSGLSNSQKQLGKQSKIVDFVRTKPPLPLNPLTTLNSSNRKLVLSKAPSPKLETTGKFRPETSPSPNLHKAKKSKKMNFSDYSKKNLLSTSKVYSRTKTKKTSYLKEGSLDLKNSSKRTKHGHKNKRG